MINKKLLIYADSKLHCIDPDNIIYIQASGSYSLISVLNGKQYKCSKNLRSVMLLMPESCNQFVKTQRSWIVNANYIESMYTNTKRSYVLEMSDGQQIPISDGSLRNELIALFQEQN